MRVIEVIQVNAGLARNEGRLRVSPVMGTGEGWGGGYAKGIVGAAFSVPCVKRPDLLPGLSLCTEPSGGNSMAVVLTDSVRTQQCFRLDRESGGE